MNNISYIGGTAEQVHAKIAELIRAGNVPTLIHQCQQVGNNTNITDKQNEQSSYAKQVINLGRKY